MSILSDAIQGKAYANMTNRSMLDLTKGGMQGYSVTPKLHEFVSNQAYVSRPLICVMLEAPKIFSLLPDSKAWVDSLRALFELHSLNIEGLNKGLTVEVTEHAVGGAGEMQHEFTDVKREPSNPNHSFIEKAGRPIQALMDVWIRYGMMDPETKFALIGALAGNSGPVTLSADWYSATCLYMEPDALHRRIDKSWIVTNMFPRGTGDQNSKRDLTSSQDILNLSYEFGGIAQSGLGVDMFAQTVLDSITGGGANIHDPSREPAFIYRATGFKDGFNPDPAGNVFSGGASAYSSSINSNGSTILSSVAAAQSTTPT